MTLGTDLIAIERRRQMEEEGYTAEHDRGQSDSLARAGAVYATPGHYRVLTVDGIGWLPLGWPWSAEAWRPTPDDRRRELVKAGALIAAAIDALEAQP